MNSTILAVTDATDTGVERVLLAAAETGASESTGHSSGESKEKESEGIGALGIDPFAIGAQLLTFLVLFFVVKKFALEGIVKNLQKRHDDINRGLHLAGEMDKQKAELDAKVEATLKAARKEADQIIAEAQTETGKMIQAAEEKANIKAEEIMRAAEGKIERDITEARNGLKKEMAGLITDATEAILGQKLDANSDRKLVEDYLKGAMK